MHSLCQLRIDTGRSISTRPGYIKLVEGNRSAPRKPTMPRRAHAFSSERWDANTPLALCINFQERLLAHDRSLIHLRVGRIWPIALRRVGDANENHVPVRTGTACPFAVARNPLLLSAGIDVAVNECVRHPSAAGPPAVLVENQIATNVHTSDGHGLRNGPLHRATRGRYGKALSGAPEGCGGIVVVVAGIGVYVAADVNGVRRGAQPNHLGIETHRHIQLISSRQEQQGIALGAELVSSL